MRPLLRLAILAASLGLALAAPAVTHPGARASAPVAGPAQTTIPPGAMRLYKFDAQRNALRALDPASLADLSGAPLLHIGPRHAIDANNAPSVAVTPDGSKFAVVSTRPLSRAPTARDMTLQLFDARTGKALSARYHPVVPFWMLGISADGARLFGMKSDIDFNLPCVSMVFYVLDARTGRMLQRTTLEGAWNWQPFLTDADLHHLYVMIQPNETNVCWKWKGKGIAPSIAAYSLDSGKRLAGIRLKDVRAGAWPTKRMVHNQTVVDYQNPGFALSPDGSQLAVLDGLSKTLVLLNAPSLKIEATESLSSAPSLGHALAGLFGLAPEVAEAKGEEEGMNLIMQYTSDGRSLLVTGSQSRIDPGKRVPGLVPLDLRLIDVASGQVKARLSQKKQIQGLWVAPDGSGMYTLVRATNTQQLCPCTIRRHDPGALAIQASRTFQNDTALQLYFLQAPTIPASKT